MLTLRSYSKKPMSWSAQDLRKAVDDAKDHVRTTRDEVARYYGSTRSLTQDLGTLNHLLHSGTSEASKSEALSKTESQTKIGEEDSKSTSSFSSYLAMRTKSPVRPPLSKSTSLQSTSTSSRIEETISEIPETKSSNFPSKLKPEKVLPFVDNKDQSSELSRAEKNKKIIQSLRLKNKKYFQSFTMQIDFSL
ncbi:hypothetical protein Avbf_09713 [Armadillidium vulgare]|nr:hypothetical protein Avbf_09713 [Armadillidium vulgare]